MHSGAVQTPGPKQVEDLRAILRASPCRYPKARAVYFGETYTPNLIDWIVYIDKQGVRHQAFTQNNRVVGTPIFRGEKFVYLLAFVEGPLAAEEPPSFKTRLDDFVTTLANDGVGRAESSVLWHAFFDDTGGVRPAMLGKLVERVREVGKADPRANQHPLLDVDGKTEAGLKQALEAGLRRIARPWDVTNTPSGTRPTVSYQPLLDRLVTLLTLGSLPPRRPVLIAADTARPRDLVTLVELLTDPTNRGRIADLRSLLVPAENGKASAPDSLRVSRDVLQYEKDPFLVALVSGFGSKLFGAGPDLGKDTRLADTSFTVELKDLGRGLTDSTHLYLARAKFSVTDNMWGRLNVYPPKNRTLGNTSAALTNFVTTSRSPFSISVSLAAVRDARTTEYATDSNGYGHRYYRDAQKRPTTDTAKIVDSAFSRSTKGSRYQVKPFILLQWHPGFLARRPAPLSYDVGLFRFESASLFLGANLADTDIFGNLIAGGSIDGLWGTDAGVMAGWVRVSDQRIDKKSLKVATQHEGRFLFGLTFRL